MRVALCPINPTIGDFAANAALIARGIEQARAAQAHLVAFPELALCGYPPRDLLMQEGFVAAAAREANRLGESLTENITAVFGLPLPVDPKASFHPRSPVANSLLVYSNNRYVEYYDKRLLPTYDVFDEDRYFHPGQRAVVVDVPCGGRTVKAGLAICEDLWKGEDAGFSQRYAAAADPVVDIMAAGAQIIVSPSASPFVLGKGNRHREILARHARTHRVPVVSVNQLGGNDELIFDGHAFVYAKDGSLIGAGKGFRDEPLILDVPLDSASPVQAPSLDRCILLGADERLLFEALVLGIRDYLRKTGFKSAIIGLSGGIDSALTAVLAVAALGPANVMGVALPGRYSSEHSESDAYELAKRLGIKCPTISIEPPFTGLGEVLNAAFAGIGAPNLGSALPDITEENLQSRIRGTLLMALSNRTGAMVLTTGNKSELGVGYCTLYGDMNGGLAVLSDVSKQWVYRLSKWINANPAACGFGAAPIPDSTITKPPSAELRPNQTDQDSLPPYDVLDVILERYVEAHQSVATIARGTGFDAALVARVVRMIDIAEYKRKQTAIGLKVTTVAFGSGRRVPIAQRWRQ